MPPAFLRGGGGPRALFNAVVFFFFFCFFFFFSLMPYVNCLVFCPLPSLALPTSCPYFLLLYFPRFVFFFSFPPFFPHAYCLQIPRSFKQICFFSGAGLFIIPTNKYIVLMLFFLLFLFSYMRFAPFNCFRGALFFFGMLCSGPVRFCLI